MSEAITNIEVNFSSNGSSHVATVSTSDVSSVCGNGGLGKVIGKIGSKSTFSKKELDDLLKDFILEEQSTTKDAFGIKRQYKYVDKLSSILDSWVILTRGITASPVEEREGSYFYEGKIYPCSELTQKTFDSEPELNPFLSLSKIKINKTAISTYIDADRRLITLGKTYSVISLSQEESLSLGLKKEKIYHVYNKQILSTALSTGNIAYPPIHEKATLKYGYTSEDFFSALKSIQIKLIDTPLFDDVLFEMSGTIRSCLSSIASFYGYYWYVEKDFIRFVNSKTANTIKIDDDTQSSDPTIISSTHTKGGRSPRLVGSFIGNTAPSKNTVTSGGFDGLQSQSIKKQFNLVDFDKIFADQDTGLSKSDVGLFFLYFISKFNSNTDSFDALTYAGLLSKLFKGGESYPYTLQKSNKQTLKQIVGEDNLQVNQQQTRGYGIADDASYYALRSENDLTPPKPSSHEFYSILKTYFAVHGRVYISKGYGARTSKNMQFTGGNVQTSGPYFATDTIEVVPELAELSKLYTITGKRKPTFREIARASGNNSNLNNFFIAFTPAILDNDVVEKINFLEKVYVSWTYNNTQYLAIDPSISLDTITDGLNDSFIQWTRMQERYKKFITIAATKVNNQDITQNDGDDDRNDPVYEDAYYKVKCESVTNFSKSELKTFSGTVQDAKILSNKFAESFGIGYDLKSSSTTYYRFYIPETIDISIDSISIGIASDGITSTITKSNKNYLPPDQSSFLSEGTHSFTAPVLSKLMSAGVRNFLKLN